VLDKLTDLNATDTLVMVALADYTSADTRVSWPSVATIARRARRDRRTVQRRLRALEQRGLVEIARGGHQYGKGSASSYRLLFDHDGRPLAEPAAATLSPRAAERRPPAAPCRPKGGNASEQGRHHAAPSVRTSVIDPKNVQSTRERRKPKTEAPRPIDREATLAELRRRQASSAP